MDKSETTTAPPYSITVPNTGGMAVPEVIGAFDAGNPGADVQSLQVSSATHRGRTSNGRSIDGQEGIVRDTHIDEMSPTPLLNNVTGVACPWDSSEVVDTYYNDFQSQPEPTIFTYGKIR